MHVVVLAIKVLAQVAFAAFVPGGGVIVALNLYRKYRARRATAGAAPAVATNVAVTDADPAD